MHSPLMGMKREKFSSLTKPAMKYLQIPTASSILVIFDNDGIKFHVKLVFSNVEDLIG